MQTIMNIVQIVIALLLVIVILVQVKGQGVGLFSSPESSYRTRRGLEKTILQFTIVLIVIFIATSLISVRVF